VPIRCIISIGIVEETTLIDPLLFISDIELMFIEKASIQSAGESPMFTWTAVFAADVGEEFDPLILVPAPPPHPLSTAAKIMARQALAKVTGVRC